MTTEIINALAEKVNESINSANAPQEIKDSMISAAANVAEELTKRIGSYKEKTASAFVKAIYFTEFAQKLGGSRGPAITAWTMFTKNAASFDK